MSSKLNNFRRKRWPWIVLPLLLLLFAANHWEHARRLQRMRQETGSAPLVRVESNLLTGHTSIGIEEKTAATAVLHFAVLGQWNYQVGNKLPCPPELRVLNGKDVSCVGFMYPLEPGAKIKTFCLMRTTQTCCYGPRPQFNQYLLTEMRTPVKFERLTPVTVTGKFVIDPQPEQGYIYRLEGQSIASAVGSDTPDETPAAASARTGLPLFDFKLLEQEAQNRSQVQPTLAVWNGREVLVAGFFYDRELGPPPQLLIGAQFWDGVSPNRRPGFFNSVAVYPADPAQMPPVWQTKGIMQGRIRVETDPKLWSKNGIVSLQQAVGLHTGLPIDPGPLVGMWEEILVFAAFVYWSWRRPRSKEENETNV